jgi:translocation protein SEC63
MIVLGERAVTPSALIHLVVKLRLSPPKPNKPEEHSNGTTKEANTTAEAPVPFTKQDEAFLSDTKDAEDLPENASSLGAAHAPHWPSVRL